MPTLQSPDCELRTPPRVAAERPCRAFHNSTKRFPPLRLLRARRPLTGDAESVNSTRHGQPGESDAYIALAALCRVVEMRV
jgi:hypothetical protein